MVAPKLRFNEFDESWSSIPLKNFVSFRKGKGISKADIKEDGIFECIRYGELYTTYGQVITTIKSRTNISPSESILSQSGDVIIPASGETQIDIATAACVAKENVILGGDLNILSHHENGEWLAYYLSSAKKLEIAQLAQGNSVVHLYSSQLKELKINKPSKTEQTKIATFLSAVDEKIAQLSQKLHLLEQYKQGMMQKIFSQQIRFKAGDGSQFGAWESKKLNEIGQSFNGLVGKSKEDFGEGEAYITYKQIFDHRKINLNNINFVNISPNDTQNMVKKGDIFFTTSSETANEVAYCSVILDDFEFPLYLNSFCFGYRPNSAKIFNSAYASFYFRSNIFRNKIKHLAQGSTRFNISKIAFMNVLIHLPMLEEQTKIANFLSTIDQKIDVVSEQLKQAKIWKKGLLQQMFV